MTNDDTTDDSQTLVTRRGCLSKAGVAAGTALVGGAATGVAAAQTDNEPRINLGDNFYIDDVDGDTLAIKDASDGSTILQYDATVGQWSTGSVSVDESRTESRTVTVNIPTDYNTVDDAIQDLREIRPTAGLMYEVHIESGHTIQTNITQLENEDLRYIQITSADSEVSVSSNHPSDTEFLRVNHCSVSPEIRVILDGNGNVGNANCYSALRGSHLQLEGFVGAGAKNWDYGASVDRCSTMRADQATFTGNTRGISITRNSVVHAQNSTLSGNSGRCVRAGGGALLNVQGSDLTNAADAAAYCSNGAMLVINSADLSGATNSAILNLGGYVEASGITADNSGSDGYYSEGGIARLDGSMTGSGGNDVVVSQGSIARVDGLATTNSSGTDPNTNDLNISVNSTTGNGIIFAQNYE